MAKDQGVNMKAARNAARPVRPPATKPAPAPQAAAPPAAPKPRVNPAQFFREVRVEGRKTTWTPWRETWVISVMVFIMVALTALFFSVVDGALNFLMQQFLRLAS